jgi:DNA-binding GntR family transcriptional regulator
MRMDNRGEGSVKRSSVQAQLERAGQSLADVAYREIEELIVRLDLAPGLPVTEAELMKRLRIGRTPVREALHRLAREGLVIIVPRRGIFVSEIRVDAQLRLLEVRGDLERLMSGRAARVATPEERQAFASLGSAMRTAGQRSDDIEFLRLDRIFNQRLAATARNEFASEAMTLMAGLSRRFWYRYYHAKADLPRTAALHADVAEAIGVGDVGAAETASAALVTYLGVFTRSVLEARL